MPFDDDIFPDEEEPQSSSSGDREDTRATTRIGAILVREGFLTQEQLDEVVEAQWSTSNEMLGETAVRLGYLNDKDLARALSNQLAIPFVDLTKASIAPEALDLMPAEVATKYSMMPIQIEESSLVLAMSDPLDLKAIDEARFISELSIRPVVVSKSQLEAAINWYYRLGGALDDLVKEIHRGEETDVEQEEEVYADEQAPSATGSEMAPIIRLVNGILLQGIQVRASDIHVEPHAEELLVRNRVDGVLQDSMRAPKWAQGAVISRLKIMAGMDITRHNVPQDGRISVKVKGRQYDMRASTLPAKFGEKVVLRILDKEAIKPELLQLGLAAKELTFLTRLAHTNQGMVLICGPTGSGKTTTLYSMIYEARDGQKNIVTIEDPIEYEIEGVNQVQVKPKDGLTFANVLRSVLRQDPDVVLLGEIRDEETASIGLQAAMTGHLVLSTLHTISAVAALPRLLDLDVAPYLVASSLAGVIAQRLARKICAECRVEGEPDAEVLERMESVLGEKLTVKCHRGAGCDVCGGSGYRGRLGVFEMFGITSEIQEMIHQRASESELMAVARKQMSRTMFRDAMAKVEEGLTTLEEVERVVPLEEERGASSGAGRRCLLCGDLLAGDQPLCPNCSAGRGRVGPTLEVAPGTPPPQPDASLARRLSPGPPPPPALSPVFAPGAPGVSTPNLSGWRVLIVDPDREGSTALGAYLSKQGFHVATTRSAHVALNQLLHDQPHLIITEAEMPGMSGIELVRSIRQNIMTAFVPVIVVSAKGSVEDRLQGLNAGCDDYMVKPLSMPELAAKIMVILRRAYRVLG